MLRTKFFGWICILFLQISVFAQDSEDHLLEHTLLLTLSPLALADIYDGASYRIGAEIKTGPKFAVAIEGGGYLNYLKSTKSNPKGFLIKPEIKYYFGQNAKGDRKFTSIEYGFKDQQYDFKHPLLVDENPVERKYKMWRKVHTVTLKYGLSRNWGRRFNLQWYAGVGLRILNSDRELSEADREMLATATDDCSLQENLIKVVGNKVSPNFQLGLRLGFGL